VVLILTFINFSTFFIMSNAVMIDNTPCHLVLHSLPCFRLLRIAMFIAFDSIEGAGIAQVWFGKVWWAGLV